MLPMIGREMGFSDMQGALLTTGYSYLYAIALVPLGMMADKVWHRAERYDNLRMLTTASSTVPPELCTVVCMNRDWTPGG